jgi:hypothetical protein
MQSLFAENRQESIASLCVELGKKSVSAVGNRKGTKHKLKLGDGVIIPAHARHDFNAKQQFKMISTIIKSGYED